jgi:hypothetical protein
LQPTGALLLRVAPWADLVQQVGGRREPSDGALCARTAADDVRHPH